MPDHQVTLSVSSMNFHLTLPANTKHQGFKFAVLADGKWLGNLRIGEGGIIFELEERTIRHKWEKIFKWAKS